MPYLRVGGCAAGLTRLLAPRTFDRLTVEVVVVNGNDGLCGRLFRREPESKREGVNIQPSQRSILHQAFITCRLSSSYCLPDESVALVFKDANLLDLSVGCKYFLKSLFGGPLRQIAAVDGAVGRRRLAKHLFVGHALRARSCPICIYIYQPIHNINQSISQSASQPVNQSMFIADQHDIKCRYQ